MKYILYCLTIFALNSHAVSLIDEHYLKLEEPTNKFYAIYKDFLIEAKKGNTKAIESVFHLYQKPLSSFYRTKLTYDLFGVFSEQPYVYIETADKYFKNEICSYSTLITELEENKMYQVEWVLNNKGADKAKSKKYLDRFKKYAGMKLDAVKVARRGCFRD